MLRRRALSRCCLSLPRKLCEAQLRLDGIFEVSTILVFCSFNALLLTSAKAGILFLRNEGLVGKLEEALSTENTTQFVA